MTQVERGRHLTKCGDIWHFQRRRPKVYEDVEPRKRIRFSLKTSDFSKARLLAAEHSLRLERDWRQAKERGVSLTSDDAAQRHGAAVETAREFGLPYTPAALLDDQALLGRLKVLLAETPPQPEQKALLGLIEKPELTLLQAFERFWEHIRDEWTGPIIFCKAKKMGSRTPLGEDQRRVKRNVYLKSMRIEKANGSVTLHEIRREQALAFRGWWMARIENEGLKPYTANREINSLRRLVSVNFDIDAIEEQNPFARVRLKDTKEQTRSPFSTEFIRDRLLSPDALTPLPDPLQWLVRLLINTGVRPSEAIGLELEDMNLSAEIPFVHIRRNKIRSLKTDHSERRIPLFGVSLDAARMLKAQGGWGKWAGKNMYGLPLF